MRLTDSMTVSGFLLSESDSTIRASVSWNNLPSGGTGVIRFVYNVTNDTETNNLYLNETGNLVLAQGNAFRTPLLSGELSENAEFDIVKTFDLSSNLLTSYSNGVLEDSSDAGAKWQLQPSSEIAIGTGGSYCHVRQLVSYATNMNATEVSLL